ncbi:MAG: tetratricopeptide repeat protein, partial [SAR324 cluster bacterium]|nr:tetratricopeptide repeat protein [SAR324 cluster bacterium]
MDKEALQAASVLGQRFSLDALQQLIGQPDYDCAPLLANGLIRPQGPDILFAHALVREGVYDSLLLTRRKALHETAAEWFAERDVELRAAHLDAAGHPDAVQAYLAAAQAQTTKFHFEPALSLAERGLLLAREEGERFSLTCFRGQMLRELGSVAESIEAYRDALPSAIDEAGRCRAWIGMAAGMRIIDQSEEALKALDQAEAEAEKAGGMTLEKAQLHYIRGSIYWPLGNIVGSLREQESALRFSHEADSPETEALALGGLGDAYYLQGRISTAHEYLKNCFELCRRHAFRRIEAANLGMSSLLRVYLTDLEGGLNDSRAAFELGGKIGHLRADLIGRGVSGYILLQMGDFEPARKFLEDYVRLSAELNAKRQNAFGLIWLSNHALATGDRGKALELVQRGLAINREVGMRFTGPWSLGILALATDDPETRLRALEEGERLLDADSIAHNHLEFYVHAMQTSLDNGNWADAERYAAALEEFTRPEPLPWSDFFIARGRALAAFGRGDRSDGICGELRHLRDKAEKVKLRLAIPALDRALASV